MLEYLVRVGVLQYGSRRSSFGFRRKRTVSGTRITYLGHTSILVECENQTLLIDPMTQALTPDQWRFVNDRQGKIDMSDLPYSLDRLPEVDAIAIGHSHPDHMDPFTLFWFDKKTVIFIPRIKTPLVSLIKPMGFANLPALKNWESRRIGRIRLTRIPSRKQRDAVGYTEQCTWLVQTPDVNAYFGTDICFMSATFKRLARKTTLDIAFLPVSQHFHYGRYVTMDARQALQASRLLKPKFTVPYACWDHWWLSTKPESFKGTRRIFMETARLAGLRAYDGPAGTAYQFHRHGLKTITSPRTSLSLYELRRIVAAATNA